MTAGNNFVSRRPSVWFLVITFVWSWGFWIPTLGFDMSDMSALPGVFYAFAFLGGFGPSVAGLFVRSQLAKVDRPRILGKPTWGLFVASALTVPLVSLATLGVSSVAGLPANLGDVLSRLPIALIWPLFSSFGEEFGWRGFLLPVWSVNGKPLKAALGIGVIWGMWHLPPDWLAMHAMGWYFVPHFLLIEVVNLTMLSVVMAAIYRATAGDVRVSIVFHYSVTFSAILLAAQGSIPPAQSILGTLVSLGFTALLGGIVAAYLHRKQGVFSRA